MPFKKKITMSITTKPVKHPPTTTQQDPRQYVPPTGQTWTSHSKLLTTHKNTFTPLTPQNKDIYSITTTPKLAIGQRALLIKTPSHGNVLWDCLTLLDRETKHWINSQGGLQAIVISHPHYYTTHLTWGHEFNCPVYISGLDAEWCQRKDLWGIRRLLSDDGATEIVPGVTAITTGGHFPGSLVLHTDASCEPEGVDGERKGRLFIADTLVTVPSALYSKNRPPGTTSYGFYWSIPNMIPLSPDSIQGIWKALEGWEFGSTHGAVVGLDVEDDLEEGGGGRVKERVRESMRIQARGMGWVLGEGGLGESWP
jgi:glyoxylase-like metal-dependent hydrolase (beta-lactamase superfamily II)